jgi:hypothetical protein
VDIAVVDLNGDGVAEILAAGGPQNRLVGLDVLKNAAVLDRALSLKIGGIAGG